jgi:hypothetical protein
MNGGVAVQAGPGKHLIRWGRSLESLKTRVDGTRVPGKIVTGLAELRYFTDQKLGVVAAVGGMAI